MDLRLSTKFGNGRDWNATTHFLEQDGENQTRNQTRASPDLGVKEIMVTRKARINKVGSRHFSAASNRDQTCHTYYHGILSWG